MKNWIPSKKSIIVSSATSLICIFFYFGSLTLVFKQITKIENYYLEIDSKLKKEEKISSIKKVLDTNSAYISSLNNLFIKKGDELSFIKNIEELARKNKITFDIFSIEINEDKEINFKEDINIKMKVDGDWYNMMNFINMLEKMDFMVLVKGLNLALNQSPYWTGTLELVIFREK